MRILHLIPSLSGGGAERQLALMAGEHVANGVESAIVYHGEGPNLALLEGSAVALFPLFIRHNYDPAAMWKILRLIRHWRPDIVQTWLPQMDILGGIAAHMIGVPHILSERSSAMAYGTDWKSRLRTVIGLRANAIIANSQSGARYWQDRGACRGLHVVANAVTPFKMLSNEPPRELSRPAILFAGRLDPAKNLENTVAGICIALARRADIRAYILGAGPQELKLKQSIAQTPFADRINFIGYVDNLAPWYSHADVLVSVSNFEGLPNVVLEAASLGCPLVLSDILEHREAIPESGALFVDGLDPPQIADNLLAVIADPVGRSTRAEVSRAFVSTLSVESQAAQYRKIYEMLIP